MPDQSHIFIESNNRLVHIDEFFLMRNVDSGEYAERINCADCHVRFRSDTQYLGNGRYIGFCQDCDNFEYFSNIDIFDLKRYDRSYPYVKALVQYHIDYQLDMTVASTYGEWITDGNHRLAAAIELGLEYVWADERDEAIHDSLEEWVSRSPAFSGRMIS